MTLAAEIAIAVLLVTGGLFGLVGSYGLLRLRDPLQRLHAPTKATTVGVGTALIASSLDLALVGDRIAWQEVLVAVLLFVTAPLSALYMAKVHIFQRVDPAALPRPANGSAWATLAPDSAGDREGG